MGVAAGNDLTAEERRLVWGSIVEYRIRLASTDRVGWVAACHTFSAQSLQRTSACFRTRSVASACLSGG
jgi:hypothetical protein